MEFWEGEIVVKVGLWRKWDFGKVEFWESEIWEKYDSGKVEFWETGIL